MERGQAWCRLLKRRSAKLPDTVSAVTNNCHRRRKCNRRKTQIRFRPRRKSNFLLDTCNKVPAWCNSYCLESLRNNNKFYLSVERNINVSRTNFKVASRVPSLDAAGRRTNCWPAAHSD
jgi:hypothetical protein